MTRIAPPPMKAMSPRRAYLLVVGGEPSPFVGSEMLYPPQNCIPPKADYRAEVTLPIARKLVGHQLANRMRHGRPVASNHMMRRFSRFIACYRRKFKSHTDSFTYGIEHRYFSPLHG